MSEEKEQHEKKEDEKQEPETCKKEHHCSVCGKLSPATICQPCEEKIRGEAMEHKRDIEKS